MATQPSISSRTWTVCAALLLLAGCNDRDEVASKGSSAALSAECTDPELIVESQSLNLWPPNHKFHDVTVDECISAISTCGGELSGEFIWASSDEPIDDLGDGHHFPDIGLGVDTGHVCVRSERQGPEDGRVYKLGVRVTDGSGQTVERECVVAVVHDKRGVPAFDSGESYTIQFDPDDAGLDCEGNPPPPTAGAGGGGAGSGDEGEAGEGGEAGNGGDPCTDPDGCDEGEPGDSGEAGEGGDDDPGEPGDEGQAGEGGDDNPGEPGDEGQAGEGGGDDPNEGGDAGDSGGTAGDGGGDDNGGDPESGGGPD